MTMHEVSPDYEQTVGAMHGSRRDSDGKQPGDPARAARVLVGIVSHPELPLRLLLGADAVAAAERASRERVAETARWAEVSRSTGFSAGEPGHG